MITATNTSTCSPYLDNSIDQSLYTNEQKIEDLECIKQKMKIIIEQWNLAINDYAADLENSKNKLHHSQSNDFTPQDSGLAYKNKNLFNRFQIRNEYTIYEIVSYCYSIFRTGSIHGNKEKSLDKTKLKEDSKSLLKILDNYEKKLPKNSLSSLLNLSSYEEKLSDIDCPLQELEADKYIKVIRELKTTIEVGQDYIQSFLEFKENNKKNYFRFHVIILASVITIIISKLFSRISYMLAGTVTTFTTLAVVFIYRFYADNQQDEQLNKIYKQIETIKSNKKCVRWIQKDLQTETPC